MAIPREAWLAAERDAPGGRGMLTRSYLPADETATLEAVTIGDLLRSVATECPDRVALVEGHASPSARRRWSYAELYADAERLARRLRHHAEPGERVVLFAGNSAEWMVYFYAVALSGCVLVPANPGYTADELTHIVASSNGAVILYADAYRGTPLAPVVDRVRKAAGCVRHAIALSDAAVWSGRSGTEPAFDSASCDAGDIALVQYTSGTTGSPKGACLHHLGIVNSTRFVGERAGLPDGDVWISPMPLFHIGASVTSGLGSLTRRGTFIIMEEFDPLLMLVLIEDERASTSLLVPTMIVALLEANATRSFDLSSFRMLFSGATTVPVALVERARRELDCGFAILFGQTELSGNVTETYRDDDATDQSESVGRPLPRMETKIVDQASGATLPIEQAGEICFRGYQVMQGYLDRPDETRKALDPDGWLRTGDLGTMDERGYLRVSGRLKDVVIRGGMNVYPREIEEVLLAHPAVADACVVGVADDRLGEIVAAVICRAGDAEFSAEDLRFYCRTRLAAYKTPALWFLAETLPRTPTGKVQKFDVIDQIAAGALRAVSRAGANPSS